MTVTTPPARRGLSPVALVAIGGVLLLAAVYVAVALATGNKTTEAPPAIPAPAGPQFDRAAFDTWWAQWAATSWGATVIGVERDGYGMTARTRLVGDADAQEPAMAICGAVLTYFGADAAPPAVRVLDRAGNTLASRRTGEAACTYRG